ncbi:uncharacterized protein [Paramormyrops kingsleyae]|uniref:uncharacterized protein n=1 Tax=Paramormyrops kingsleyae TaxID=1676925 RepID=UPI003B974363
MLQFRRTFENEKVQLQELNRRLSHYLSRVKHLEQENACLVKEISVVRNERTFEWEDQYLAELRELRTTVDQLAFEKSKAEVERERLRREFQTVQTLLFEESGMCRDIDGELKACKVQFQQAQAKNADLEDFLFQLENESRLLQEEHRREISHVKNTIYSRALSNVTQTYRAVPPITVEEVEQCALSMSDNCMEMFEVYRKRVEDLEESLRADEAKVEDLRREKNQYATDFEKLRYELEEQNRLQVHLEGQLKNTQDKYRGELDHYQMIVEDLEQERMFLTSAIADKLKEHQDLMQVKMGLSLELAAYRALLEGEQRDAYLSAGRYLREAPRRIGSSIVRQDRRPPVNTGFETRYIEQVRSSKTSPGISHFRSYEGPGATIGRASSRRDIMLCSKTPQVPIIAVRPVTTLQKCDLKTEIAEEVMVQKKDVSQHSVNHQQFVKDFSPLPSPTSDQREIDREEANKTCVRVVSPPMMSLITMSEKEGGEDAGDVKADESEDRKEADYNVILEQGKIDEEEEVEGALTLEEVTITTQDDFSDDSQIKEEEESKRIDPAEEQEEGEGSQKEEVTVITQEEFSDDSQIKEEKGSKRIEPAEELEEGEGSQKEVTVITQEEFSDDSQIKEEKESKRIDPAEEQEEGEGSQKEVTVITQEEFSDDSQIKEEKESKRIDPAEEQEEGEGSQKEEVTVITQEEFSDDLQIKKEKESKRIDPAEEQEESEGYQKEEVTEITQEEFSDDSQTKKEKESKRIDPAEEQEEGEGSQKEEVTEITQEEFSDDSQIKKEKESKRIDPAEEQEEGGGSQKEEVTEITQEEFSDDSQIKKEKESKRIDPAEEQEEGGGSQKEEVTVITQEEFSDDSQIKKEKESKRIDPAEEQEEGEGSQKEEVTEITQEEFSDDSQIKKEKESKRIDPAEEQEEGEGSQKEEVTEITQEEFSDDSQIKEEMESKRIDPAEEKTIATVSLEEIIEKVIKPAGLDAHLSSSPDSKITYHVEKTEAENGKTQIILESKIEEDLDVSDEALEELLSKEVKKVTLEDVKGTAAGSMIENLLSFGLAKGENLEKLSVNVEIIEEPLEAHSKEDSKVTPTTAFFQSSSKCIQIEELENDPPPPEHYDSGVEELKTSMIAKEYGTGESAEVQEGLKVTDVTYYIQETEYFVSTPDDDPEEGPLSSSEHCEAVHGLSDEMCNQEGPAISQEDSGSQELESKVTYMISELACSEDRDLLCVVEEEIQVSPQMKEATLDVLQEDSKDPKQQLREPLEELQGEVSGELKENVSLITRNDEEGDDGLSVDIRKVQKDSDENSMTIVAEINVSQTLEGSELLEEQDKDTFQETERSVNVDGSTEEHNSVSRSEESSTPQTDVRIRAPHPQADRSEEVSQEGDLKTWQEYTAECTETSQVLQSKEALPQLKVSQEETIVYLESREEA